MSSEQKSDPAVAIPHREPERLWRELVGEELRAIRHARDETLQTVARRAGVSTQYLSEIERGTKEPSSEMVAAVGTALGVSLLDLTTGVASRLIGSATASAGSTVHRATDVALAA